MLRDTENCQREGIIRPGWSHLQWGELQLNSFCGSKILYFIPSASRLFSQGGNSLVSTKKIPTSEGYLLAVQKRQVLLTGSNVNWGPAAILAICPLQSINHGIIPQKALEPTLGCAWAGRTRVVPAWKQRGIRETNVTEAVQSGNTDLHPWETSVPRCRVGLPSQTLRTHSSHVSVSSTISLFFSLFFIQLFILLQ